MFQRGLRAPFSKRPVCGVPTVCLLKWHVASWYNLDLHAGSLVNQSYLGTHTHTVPHLKTGYLDEM